MTKNDKLIPVPDYLRIRRFILNRLYRLKKGDDLRIPSLGQLMKEFNVSRPTVCKALNQLIADGYLTSRQGVGIFVNPKYTWTETSDVVPPVIGIVILDGMLIHFDTYFGALYGALLQEAVKLPAIVHELSLAGIPLEKMADYLQKENLDLLCWIQPRTEHGRVIEELKAKGMPVVITGDVEKKVSDTVFLFDYSGLAEELVKIILKEKRKKILCTGSRIRAKGGAVLEKMLPNADIMFLEQGPFTEETICKYIREHGIPDVIYNLTCPYREITKVLEKFNINTEQKCLLIQNNFERFNDVMENGICFEFPVKEFAEKVTEKINERLNNGNKTEVPVYLPFHIKHYKRQKEVQL